MSDRDKRILLILLMAVIIGGSFWVFKKTSDGNAEYKSEVRILTQRHSDLVAKNAKKSTYVKDTTTNITAFNKVFSEFNSSLSQEQTLLFLSAVEKNTGVWLKQQSLDTVSQVYQFGKIKSSNPSAAGRSVYTTDNVGVVTNSNVSYECTYDELKAVLLYLRENGKKVAINSMSYNYAAATDTVTGTMSLSFYAIQGSDRPAQEIDIKDVFVGTDNIFASDTFVSNGTEVTYKDKIIADYDAYVIVNRTGADKDAVICGQAGDANNQTVVSSNTGGTENVVIKITGREGDYKISYQVGANQYPAESFDQGAPFICGDSIDLLVISSERGGSNDTSQINLKIINESDLAVNGAVINDDPTLPRVIHDGSEGAVTFYP